MTARVRLQNQLGSAENRSLTLFLWPLLQVKRIFDTLYHSFLKLIWSELVGQPTAVGPMQVGALFLLFAACR
ncbi:MAG: hypothetical protein HC812_04655 [Leptolyngbya sp. RL_3_1]|nr:hypothetical protein [Leptolyngbya sp. RL_3_1]